MGATCSSERPVDKPKRERERSYAWREGPWVEVAGRACGVHGARWCWCHLQVGERTKLRATAARGVWVREVCSPSAMRTAPASGSVLALGEAPCGTGRGLTQVRGGGVSSNRG